MMVQLTENPHYKSTGKSLDQVFQRQCVRLSWHHYVPSLTYTRDAARLHFILLSPCHRFVFFTIAPYYFGPTFTLTLALWLQMRFPQPRVSGTPFHLPLASIPYGVLSDFTLLRLPPRSLGCSAMTCTKIRKCAGDAILQIAKSIHLERREGETLGSLLFAIRVQCPKWGVCARREAEAEWEGAHMYSDASVHGDGRGIVQLDATNFHAFSKGNRRVTQVAAGNSHMALVTSGGLVYTLGDGEYGQLGRGHVIDRTRVIVPMPVKGPLEDRFVVKAAVGMHHTAAVTNDGFLYTFGNGKLGQLGHPSSENSMNCEYTPRRVETLAVELGAHVVDLALGSYHSIVVCSRTGRAYSFGVNWAGELGHGPVPTDELHSRSRPREVVGLHGKPVVGVSAGAGHSAVITADGALYTFGRRMNGRLGHPEEDGTGGAMHTPRQVDALRGKRVVQVAAGGSHTVALTSDGEMFTFGDGKDGQLGHGNGRSRNEPERVEAMVGKWVVQVATPKAAHTSAVTVDGEVFTCGRALYRSRKITQVPRSLEALEALKALNALKVEPVTYVVAGVLGMICLTDNACHVFVW